MSQMRAFIEKAENDSGLMDKLNKLGASGAGPDKVVALAAEYGFSITAEDFLKAMETVCPQAGKLTEEDLEAVAGGNGGLPTRNRWDPDECKKIKTCAMRCFGMGYLQCDHYSISDTNQFMVFRNICRMGMYDYIK